MILCMIILDKVRSFVLGKLGTNWAGEITNIFFEFGKLQYKEKHIAESV